MSLMSKMTWTSLNPGCLYRIRNYSIRAQHSYEPQSSSGVNNCFKLWKLFTSIPVHWDAVGDHFQSRCSFQSRISLASCCPVPTLFNLCFLMVRLQIKLLEIIMVLNVEMEIIFTVFYLNLLIEKHTEDSDKFVSLNLPLINSQGQPLHK